MEGTPGEKDCGEVSRHGNRADRLHGDAGLQESAASWQVLLHERPQAVDAAEWDDLLAASGEPTPFMCHAWLVALHESGCARASAGWQPLVVAVRRGGALAAAAMLYLKDHSYGEYVFDWAWADAWQRAGHAYYPKLLGAVPFTPVPGTRLLARDDAARGVLLEAIEQVMRENGLSSAHLLFLSAADRTAAEAAGWLLRRTVQFHWHNRSPAPYADFTEFLSTLQRDKRKKIAQERRYVREAGISFRTLRGREIGASDWDFFFHCYTLTYRAHRSTPYLNRDFFARVAQAIPEHWLMFVAERDGRPVGSSLIALDPLRGTAWGRYWGATEAVRCLHFDACYYRPLEWCIENGWQRFEGGAQGEHKMARGLLPVTTWSAHRLAHPGFEEAVAQFLAREGRGIAAYVDELSEHSPFRAEVSESGRSGGDAPPESSLMPPWPRP